MISSGVHLRYRRVAKAVWSGGAARVLSSSIALLSLPLAVRYLGAERYGVWATITTTAVWMNLLDLGIANTLTNHIAESYALKDERSACRWLTNALFLTGGIAICAGGAAVLIFPHINWTRLLNVSATVSRTGIERTAAAATALMLLGLPLNLVSKVLAGYQELHRNNYGACLAAIASLCGLALGVALRVSMPILFMMSAGMLVFGNMLMLVLVVGRLKPWLKPRLSLVDRASMRELFCSGSSFFLIQIAAVVVFSSDNLIVSHYLGASEVTPYSITWRVVGLLTVLQSLIFPALWPAYAEAYANGDYRWIRKTFVLSMTGVVGLNLVGISGLLGFGRSLIRVWAGPAAVPSLGLLLAMSVWALINGFMSVESCLLAALNRTREQAVLSIVAAALNLVLSIAWVRRVGSLGVIGGTVVSYLLVLVAPQTMILRRVWKKELAVETATSILAKPKTRRIDKPLEGHDESDEIALMGTTPGVL